MSRKAKLKKFYQKQNKKIDNMFKPKKKKMVSEKKQQEAIDRAIKQNNKAIAKRNAKKINYVFGGEYKDRNKEW